jgi:hypothetical protein
MTQPTSPSPEFYAEYTPAAPPAALPRPPLRLSCVVPAFNEAVNLPRFIPALAEAVANGMKMWLGAIPEDLYTLFGVGYLGYAGARTWEKRKGSAK